MLSAFLLAIGVVGVGFIGTAAFNPDDGFALQSLALWRVFGISAYLGVAAVYLIPLVALARLILRSSRRRRSS